MRSANFASLSTSSRVCLPILPACISLTATLILRPLNMPSHNRTSPKVPWPSLRTTFSSETRSLQTPASLFSRNNMLSVSGLTLRKRCFSLLVRWSSLHCEFAGRDGNPAGALKAVVGIDRVPLSSTQKKTGRNVARIASREAWTSTRHTRSAPRAQGP